jgi:hypothetical protein
MENQKKQEIEKIHKLIYKDVEETEMAIKTDTLASLIEEESLFKDAQYKDIVFYNRVIEYQINSFIENGRNDYTKFTSVAKLLRLIKVLEDLHNQEQEQV